ncbi:DUF6294 family protein [Kribbella sp. NPDC051587]|uniref:DUF6294 family protein n=1 Tax=Kribbella sp. NPDC051587 TaxID=3364119 RepID=UPI0037BA33D5
MNRKLLAATKFALVVVAGSVAVTGPALASPAAPVAAVVQPSAGTFRPAVDSMFWQSDSDSHAGDCTMFRGAGWTLRSDGSMSFDGVVTSSDDGDVWLMRVRVLDRSGAELGWVTNATQQTPDPATFAKNMPSSSDQYHWLATGFFPAGWYGLIGSIEIHNHC